MLGSVAHADGHFNAHFGAGLGAFPNRTAPAATAEVGLLADWVGERGIGVGIAVETVARPGEDLSTYEEGRVDLLLRFATPNRNARMGVGAGLRFMTPSPKDGVEQALVRGVDLLRVDVSGRFATLYRTPGLVISADGFFSFAFGCFVSQDAMPERPDLARDPRCNDTIVATYVVGLQFAVSTR
jgi:hypothetical protein